MGNKYGKNPTLGITVEEKKMITKTWNMVKPKMAMHGATLFVMFFTDYPVHKKYFPFKMEGPNLADEPLLKKHGLKVMTQLNQLILNIKNQETLLYLLRSNALNHRSKKIHKVAYDNLRATILKLLLAGLGPSVATPEVVAAWDHALKTAFQVIMDINDQAACCCKSRKAAENLETSDKEPDQSASNTTKKK